MHTGQEHNYENPKNVEYSASQLRCQNFLIDSIEEVELGCLGAVLEIGERAAYPHKEGKESRPRLNVVPLKEGIIHVYYAQTIVIYYRCDSSGYQAGELDTRKK